MIDNFDTIENNLLEFEKGTYYKFEALVRNTDGCNSLYYEGASKTNKNILIKTWWIDTEEYYQRMKNEMRTLCDMTNARLYVLLDRKNLKRTLAEMSKISTQLMIQSYVYGSMDPEVSAVHKISGTASSVNTSSERGKRMWMFDVDSDDFRLLQEIQNVCYPHKFFTLRTKKGYHVCVTKEGFKKPNADYINSYLYEHRDEWSVQGNAMGLVYMPDKVALRGV